MKPKALLILIVLTAFVLAAAYFATRPSAPSDAQSAAHKGLMFPALATRANDVTEIVIKRPELTFTVRKDTGDTGLWRVVEKANYPARTDTLRAFIIALSQLRELERKTSLPELYSKLGVEDPVAPAAVSSDHPMPQSTLVTLKDAKGETIASAVLGNVKWGAPPGIYVRRMGEPTVWLAEGRIDVQRDPIKWTEDQFANIRSDRVSSVVITPPGDNVIEISRAAQSDTFAVQDLPAGRELKDPGVGESFASLLTTLPFQDVALIKDVDFTGGPDGKPGARAELRTFDGLIITIQSIARDGRTWWKLAASVDESIPAQVPPPPDQDQLKTPAATTLAALQKEADALNGRWSLYAFAPVDWKARTLNHTLAELLKDSDPPAATPPASAPAPTVPPAPVP